MKKDVNYKYKSIVEYIRKNGTCTTKQIGVSVFKLTGASATNTAGTYLRRMKSKRIVRSKKIIGGVLAWELTGHTPDDWKEEIIDTKDLFRQSHINSNRQCYNSYKGFVHCYNPGQRICSCKLEKIKCP